MREWATRFELEKELLPVGSSGVEIGVLRGTHAKWLLDNINPEKMYLIDHWLSYVREGTPVSSPKREHIFRKVCELFHGNKQVEILRGGSDTMHPRVPDGSLGWVYVDGLHTFDGCLSDMILYRPKIVSGGIMMCHDYNQGPTIKNGVAGAVREYLRRYPSDSIAGRSLESDGEVAILIGNGD